MRIAPRLKLKGAPRLLDIGSGGGFPGIVLKLALPDLEIQLVEATRKKARFLADVAAGLDLRQTSIIWGRAEDLADVQHLSYKREFVRRFDWVTGKALGTLGASTALAAPFLRPEGAHWTFKGKACQTELASAGGVFRQRGFATCASNRSPATPSRTSSASVACPVSPHLTSSRPHPLGPDQFSVMTEKFGPDRVLRKHRKIRSRRILPAQSPPQLGRDSVQTEFCRRDRRPTGSGPSSLRVHFGL
jgi:16S rRNA (guanine(527)-N(7))-methyltransferase RsmG